jgi:hypothetical protein
MDLQTRREEVAMKLFDVIKGVEDPRKARGVRHSISALILLILCGLISGYKDLSAIARWGRSLKQEDRERLGFSRVTPCSATLSNILRAAGTKNLQEHLNKWLEGLGASSDHLALDGKTLRASHGSTINAQVHLLSLFCQKSGIVVRDTPMVQGENEITAALRLLQGMELTGKVITGDAIFAQKKSANLSKTKAEIMSSPSKTTSAS